MINPELEPSSEISRCSAHGEEHCKRCSRTNPDVECQWTMPDGTELTPEPATILSAVDKLVKVSESRRFTGQPRG